LPATAVPGTPNSLSTSTATPAVLPATATALPATAGADFASLAGTVAYDVTYCTSAEGIALQMDVYYPASLAAPAPAVVFIHGGGWSSGDKRQGAQLFRGLVAFDFVVVSLNYRHAPEFPYPAQIQDVKCALRSLRANAVAHGIDSARIGAMGSSAGAHLAAILGLTEATPGWDTGQYLDQSSRVAAVVDFFGPMDLTQPFPGIASAIGEQVFGATSPDDRVLVEASPVTYITADDPPFLIIHGAADEFVPPSQSQILYDRLTAAGVPAELVLVENGRHAFIADTNPVSPSREALVLRVVEFFNEHLK
jgi:acetyl esterase/lipase